MLKKAVEPVMTNNFPLILEFSGQDNNEFLTWYRNNKVDIEGHLQTKGAILFRGLAMASLEDFDYVTGAIKDRFVNYIDGFSPRTKLSKNTYTSTEYDADFIITLHNELSFSNKWPAYLFFFCLQPAESGGETVIVDGREIIKKMRPELLQEFNEKGVNYIRNLHNGQGLGPSWQETYETESREIVEEFCRKGNIHFEWKDDGGLKIIYKKDAFLNHPITGEQVWFNQVDQFHPCHLQKDIYEMLMELHSHDEPSLPMYGSFGDNSRIDEQKVHEVQKTINDLSSLVRWKKGDLLLLDNVLIAHGRMPFAGERKIIVAMSE